MAQRGDPIDTGESDTEQEFLGELRYAPRIARTRHVLVLGVGSVLGVTVLFSGPLESALGTSAVIAALVATLALGLSTLNVLELLGGSGGRGGSYGLVVECIGGLASFLTGWGLATAQAGLVAALLLFVGQAAVEAFSLGVQAWVLALGFLLALIGIQVFQLGRGRGLSRTLLYVALAALASVLVVSLRGWSGAAARPDSAVEAAQVWREAGRLAVLYMAVEAVLASRRQIRTRTVSVARGLVAVLLVGGLLAALVLTVGAGVGSGDQDLSLLVALWGAARLPLVYVAGALSLAALFTAGSLILFAARQINDMSRRGGLPEALRRTPRHFVLPPRLFLVLGAVAAALLFAAPAVPLVDLAAWLSMAALIFVNIAAISSRRNEPERRRILELPFFPLLPALAIGLLISLMLNLSTRAHALGLAWLGAGALLYALYSRRRQAAALEGVTLFGSDQRVEKGEGIYRILVPIAPGERNRFLLDTARALARQLGGDVMPLQVITVADPMAMERGRKLARERNQLFRWTTRRLSDAGVPVYPVTRLARTVPEGIVDTVVEEQCDLLLMPWDVGEADESERMGEVIDPVISQSPCDVAVLTHRGGGEQEEGQPDLAAGIHRIVVPTAGGPHAPLAVGLAWILAREHGAQVVATYVASDDASEAELEAGRDSIRSTLEQLQASAAVALSRDEDESFFDFDQIETEVIRAPEVVEGILEAGGSADMLLIGASEESVIDQMLFGNLPRTIAALSRKPVMMVRRYRGLPRFWLRRIWESLFETLPTVGREEQIEIYKLVRRGARPDIDFFVMIGLSAVIATLGLLLNSGAVIIGAMLVAPLFTPLLAISMAIAVGDVHLIRLSLESNLKGIALSIGLALVIAFLAPLPIDPLSVPEIAGRTQPNLLDLGVALAAGAAGAYAIARKDVAAALPGVAIAAALVPPLGVIGVGLSEGAFLSAGGAFLLVTTNLIAISLSGAITLLLLGFRPAQRTERRARLRIGLTATLILLLVIAIPLGLVLGRGVERSRTQQTIQSVLRQELAGVPDARLEAIEVQEHEDRLTVTATLHVAGGGIGVDGEVIVSALERAVERPVTLRLVPIPVMEFESGQTP